MECRNPNSSGKWAVNYCDTPAGKPSSEALNKPHRTNTPDEYIQEIVDDAFLAARSRWKTLRNENPRAYVFTVARNQRNSKLRGHMRRNDKLVIGLPVTT